MLLGLFLLHTFSMWESVVIFWCCGLLMLWFFHVVDCCCYHRLLKQIKQESAVVLQSFSDLIALIVLIFIFVNLDKKDSIEFFLFWWKIHNKKIWQDVFVNFFASAFWSKLVWGCRFKDFSNFVKLKKMTVLLLRSRNDFLSVFLFSPHPAGASLSLFFLYLLLWRSYFTFSKSFS